MEFLFKTLKEFESAKDNVLSVIPKEEIKKRLMFDKEVKITTEETDVGELLIRVNKGKRAEEIGKRITITRKRLVPYLNEYFISGNNELEKIREEIISLKSKLGENWYKDKVYCIDKCAGVNKFLFKNDSKTNLLKWITENPSFIFDAFSKDSVTLGKCLSSIIFSVSYRNDKNPEDVDLVPLFNILLNELSYKNITIDCSYFSRNRSLSFANIILSKKRYAIKGLTCSSLGEGMIGGSLILLSSCINSLLNNAQNVTVHISACLLGEEPFKGAKGLTIKSKDFVITSNIRQTQIKKSKVNKKQLLREALFEK